MWARAVAIVSEIYSEKAIVTAQMSISDEVWGHGVKCGVTRGRSGTPVEEWT